MVRVVTTVRASITALVACADRADTSGADLVERAVDVPARSGSGAQAHHAVRHGDRPIRTADHGATIELLHWTGTAGGAGRHVAPRRRRARTLEAGARHERLRRSLRRDGVLRELSHRGSRRWWRHPRSWHGSSWPTRHLDITIDPTTPRVLRRFAADTADFEWSCARVHTPRDEWWRRDGACPDGTHLDIHIDAEDAVSPVACKDRRGEVHARARRGWRRRADG